MAVTTTQLPSGIRQYDTELWTVTFAVADQTASIPTSLSSIVHWNAQPVTNGTSNPTADAGDLQIVSAITATETGSAAGVQVSGTGVTVSLSGTATAAKAYQVLLYGRS